MRQFTTPEQTARLVELGFTKPKISAPVLKWVDDEPTFELQYTIGELIEMLPPRIKGINLSIDRYYEFEQWLVYWNAGNKNEFFRATELIDALYNAIIKLKEEGVI